MKTVIYIGNFSFPDGNASGKRVYANGKMLKKLGYNVILIGMSKDIVEDVTIESTKKTFDNFDYYNLHYPKRTIDWMNYNKRIREFREFVRHMKLNNTLDMVIYYGSPTVSIFNTKLIKYCKTNNIKIVADCVDWLSSKTTNPIFNVIKWMDTTYQKSYANNKTDGVITISSYLAQYYGKHKKKTVVIPPLSTLNRKLVKSKFESDTNQITITYAGIPFRIGTKYTTGENFKDRIDKTIILLSKLKEEGYNFVLNIYGFSRSEYLNAIPSQKKYVDDLGENIYFYGFVDSKDVLEKIKKSDFTILVRDINKGNTAGFPTKISESISCGVPVITTKTSDIDQYVNEGVTGFFLDFNEINAIEQMKYILEISNDELLKIKMNCINSEMFYYGKYILRLKVFLDSLN